MRFRWFCADSLLACPADADHCISLGRGIGSGQSDGSELVVHEVIRANLHRAILQVALACRFSLTGSRHKSSSSRLPVCDVDVSSL